MCLNEFIVLNCIYLNVKRAIFVFCFYEQSVSHHGHVPAVENKIPIFIHGCCLVVVDV